MAAVVRAGIPVHCLRDVTRGGLTATLSEIAESSGLTVKLDEVSIPVREDVRAACGLLGLDPLQVACEGRYLAILPREHEEEALRLMRGLRRVRRGLRDRPCGRVWNGAPADDGAAGGGTGAGHAFRDAAAPHLLMLPAVSSGVAFPAFWQGSGWGRLPARSGIS